MADDLKFDQEHYDELYGFHEECTYEEYREMVLQSLIYCMSRPEYHKDHALAAAMVRVHEQWIRDGYAAKENPNSVAADVGFCCG